MNRLAAILLPLALLLCSLTGASGAANFGSENRVGPPWENPNIYTGPGGPVAQVNTGGNALLDYDVASGMGYGPNLYAYVRQNPWTLFDPLGLEPVKEQAGTIQEFVSVMNNSPSKIGTKKGDFAFDAVKSFGNTKKLKPTVTPYFNQKKGRYVYTKKGGWVDMVHFTFYAGKAVEYKQLGAESPIGEALQDGYLQERMDKSHSKFSYEDLASDKFGADFGANHFDPESAKTVSEQVQEYFEKNLDPASPSEAPNFAELPEKHEDLVGKKPTATNKTTKPLFTTGAEQGEAAEAAVDPTIDPDPTPSESNADESE